MEKKHTERDRTRKQNVDRKTEFSKGQRKMDGPNRPVSAASAKNKFNFDNLKPVLF